VLVRSVAPVVEYITDGFAGSMAGDVKGLVLCVQLAPPSNV
jgi:hypothetical protein